MFEKENQIKNEFYVTFFIKTRMADIETRNIIPTEKNERSIHEIINTVSEFLVTAFFLFFSLIFSPRFRQAE